MPNIDPNYLDLYDILPDAHPSYDWRDGSMARVEREVLTPALTAAGYTVGDGWWSGEKDSFGPLSRCVRVVTPEGENKIVVYG